jgi:hypothetical protein
MTHANKPTDQNPPEDCAPAQVPANPQGRTLRLPGATIVLEDPVMFEAIRAQMGQMLNDAVAFQGSRSLESTLSAAKVHEAGHAVVFAHFDRPVILGGKIWQIENGPERDHWAGETLSDESFRSDSMTSAEEDFEDACGVCGGVLAELIFNREIDPRFASPIDDVIVTIIVACNRAAHTGRHFGQLVEEILSTTITILKSNGDVVRALARDLERYGGVRKRRREELLGRVAERAKATRCTNEGDSPLNVVFGRQSGDGE